MGKDVNLRMWKWWKKYKEKKAKKKEEDFDMPDVTWVPRRFGDKIIMCPRPNTSKDAWRYI